MKTGIRELALFFFMASLITNFGVQAVTTGSFAPPGSTPGLMNYFNWGNDLNAAFNLLGGHWSFLGFALPIENIFTYPIAFVMFIGSIIIYLALIVAFVIGGGLFLAQNVPSIFGVFLYALSGGTIGLSLAMGIQVASSRVGNR